MEFCHTNGWLLVSWHPKRKKKYIYTTSSVSLMKVQPSVLKCRQSFSNTNVHRNHRRSCKMQEAWSGTRKSAFPASCQVWLLLLSRNHTGSSKAFRCSINSSFDINTTTFQQQDSGVNSLQNHMDPEPEGFLNFRHTSEEFMLLDSLNVLPYFCRGKRGYTEFSF